VLALANSAGWDAVKECLWDNTIGRATGGTTEDVGFLTHTAPPWYYVLGFPQALVPWALAIPALVAGGTLAATWRAGRSRYLAFLALAGVLLLSIPAGKRSLYVVPLFPATAAVLGTWLSRAGSRRGGRLDRATFVVILGGLAALAASAAWITSGAYVPAGHTADKFAAFLDYHRGVMPVVATTCATVAVALAVLAFRASRGPVAVAARRAAVAIAAMVFLFHAGGRPLIDRPVNDMEQGAIELARAVPESEEMLAVAPDETTRAVVPFYTGRMLRPVRPPPHPKGTPPGPLRTPGPLGTTPWRYLVVIDSSEPSIDAETRAHLHLERTVALNGERTVHVYRYDSE
jgi:hypothetical protein